MLVHDFLEKLITGRGIDLDAPLLPFGKWREEKTFRDVLLTLGSPCGNRDSEMVEIAYRILGGQMSFPKGILFPEFDRYEDQILNVPIRWVKPGQEYRLTARSARPSTAEHRIDNGRMVAI